MRDQRTTASNQPHRIIGLGKKGVITTLLLLSLAPAENDNVSTMTFILVRSDFQPTGLGLIMERQFGKCQPFWVGFLAVMYVWYNLKYAPSRTPFDAGRGDELDRQSID
ncbi:hypothetical protein JDV02_010168 [Purpureocillium takamizusanense]|uniref:Uncharacterized protein n=1 Tax=Purpureocillium takamizusanense TaxID=2060973 RepID=A0A9Q8VH04_9HYPO|nr:uncharacterized protein JDV02_010168 [Purpureocillium takamizusanense]UNI24424.1 hypothetical protein JDV02_010168 [Purpureocillium takamizusanense]